MGYDHFRLNQIIPLRHNVKTIPLTFKFLIHKINIMDIFNDDRKLIRLALAEDIGKGDITTRALKLDDRMGKAVVVAKASGVISGISAFKWVYETLSPVATFDIFKPSGSLVVPGNDVIQIDGPLKAILMGERTAMNFLCHLSGVATVTHWMVKAIQNYPAKILDTRKTMPGMRRLEKQAVLDGGGTNHRLGLFDMYLIKENHIAAAGGLKKALDRVGVHRKRTGAKVEVEVKNMNELRLALKHDPDYLLLDNFTIAMLKKAVCLAREIAPGIILEASGNVAPETVRKIAATGVDRISVGRITHSAPALDLSLKILD
jgi:nicotinate-nucleotide pyrophosphorylase (carboxylating)